MARGEEEGRTPARRGVFYTKDKEKKKVKFGGTDGGCSGGGRGDDGCGCGG